MLKVRNVGVVGTGLIGASWAAYYASKDFKVRMFDKISAAQESGLQRAIGYLDGLAQYGLIDKSRAEKMKGNISSAGSLGAGCFRCGLCSGIRVRKFRNQDTAIFRDGCHCETGRRSWPAVPRLFP